jgi:hypothetical protein
MEENRMSKVLDLSSVDNLRTEYVPILHALVSRLTGDVGTQEVQAWRRGLHEAVVSTTWADGLRLLVDTYDYRPRGLEVQRELHQALMTVLSAVARRAVVFLHHDGAKMSLLDAAAEDGVRYLSDPEEAVNLLRTTVDSTHPAVGLRYSRD